MTKRGWVAEARPYLGPIIVGAASLALATIVALALEAWFSVADASPVRAGSRVPSAGVGRRSVLTLR
jgi:hypothetical protein